MSIRRAADGSTAVSLARRARSGLASLLSPVSRRLAAVDRALASLVRGSWLYRWLTADPDPEPVVIDLRETHTVGPVLAVLERVGPGRAGSRVAAASGVLAERIAAAPARAVGFAITLGFAASLLATALGGPLTPVVYGFHALGLLVGLVALRERRPAEELADAPVWGPLIAVFAPPPAPDDEGDR